MRPKTDAQSDDATVEQGDDLPLVSVVVATYNYAHFLPVALDSVLAQDYPNFEVIVVDDGSTDDTEAVVAPYVARGVRYIRQENQGIGQSKNTGIRAARGSLIGFLDADDAWLPEKLSLQVDHFRRHPEVALVTGGVVHCDEHLRPRRVGLPPQVGSAFMFERLLVKSNIAPTSVLVRASALEAVGGFSERPISQDWDTWLRLAPRFPFGSIHAPLVKKRDHGSKTRTAAKRLQTNAEVFESHIGAVRPRWKRYLLRRRSRAATLYYAAASSVKRGDRRRAARFLSESLLLDPITQARDKLVMAIRIARPRSAFRRLSGLLPRRRARGSSPVA